MRKIIFILFLVIFSVLFFHFSTQAMMVEEINPTDYVTDYTFTLGKDERDKLSKILGDLEKQTGYQVAVVMINSLEGDYIEHFAVKLFEKLKIGSKEKDEGVLFLIAKGDRQMRMEVGYGLEPVLTDGVTKNILDNFVKPEFLKDNYYGGIKSGVEKMVETLYNGEINSTQTPGGLGSDDWLGILIFFFVFLVNILGWLFAIIARTKSWWLGGVVTFFIGAPILYYFGLSFVNNTLLFVFTLTGFLFDYFVSKNYKYWESKLQFEDGPTGKPSWWAGGTWGPGSDPWKGSGWGGSGFGGFGGGSSGGGGSNSSW